LKLDAQIEKLDRYIATEAIEILNRYIATEVVVCP